jgi:hypothetical protein
LTTHFVLFDFENVQPKDVALLNGGAYTVKVFLGANQKKIPLEMVRAVQALGPAAEYVEISGNGRNALDFHIAYYIGRLAAETPEASFRVISKDTGFDPLLKHLAAQGISCKRSTSIADIPPSTLSKFKSIPEMADAVIDKLVKPKATKPGTVKTFRNALKAQFRMQADDQMLDELIEHLTKSEVLRIVDGKIHYELP